MSPRPRRHRGIALSARGMVSAAHPLASLAGARTLASGGNAYDAALAMAGMTAVVLPGMCGVGGDAFAVVYDAKHEGWTAYMGSGTGPDGGDVAFYRERGHTALPIDGPLSVAVPGAVDCWQRLHAAGATRSLEALWAPAIEAAREGFVVGERIHEEAVSDGDKLRRDPVSHTVYLPGGAPPAVGSVLRQADLATTLEALARDPRSFYEGDLAQLCVATLTQQGAPFSGEEWAAHETLVDTPIEQRYGDVTVRTTLPPSPGYMVAQQLMQLDGRLRGRAWLGADAVDMMATAAREAFADRYRSVASDNGAHRRLLQPLPAGGDTTCFVAVDSDGNAVSFIQSVAFVWGSGVMVPGTGVLLNNRAGRGFYLDDTHPNRVRPRARPMHTLNAWILAGAGDRPLVVGATPGGDGQVQWNTQMISHLVDHGLDVQQTVEAPRFTVWPGSDANVIGSPTELRCEARLGEETIESLRERGHNVVRLGDWDAGGGAQVIAVDREHGTLRGGSDPRVDGCALGI